MAAKVILLEVQPRNTATGVRQTVRFAGGGADFPYRYGGQDWQAGLTVIPTVGAALEYDGVNLALGAIPQALSIDWAPSTTLKINAMSALHWKGAPFTIYTGDENAAGTLPAVLFTGKVLGHKVTDSVLQLAMADPAADMQRPIVVDTYTGAGGVEGPVEWKGRRKRRVWGRAFNIEGEPVDPANNIYAFGDPARPWNAFDEVRDRGAIAAATTTVDWAGSIAATFAALQAAAAPSGGGVLCPSIAMVKWWTRPAGLLCADVQGENTGGYVETAAGIVNAILTARAAPALVAGTVAAINAIRPDACQYVADDLQVTIGAALDWLLGGVSLLWVLEPAGTIRIAPWAFTASVGTFTSDHANRLNSFAPMKSRRVGYRRNHRQMAAGDLAAILTYGNGVPIDNLMPAQAGATVGAVIGTNLSLSTAVVPTESQIVTLQGIAAGFTGQGTLSLENFVPPASINFAPGNLILDPQLLTNSWWSLLSQAAFETTVANFALLGANKAIMNTASGNSNWRSGLFQVKPGRQYQVGFNVLLKAGWNSNIIVSIRWYKRDGTTAASTATSAGKYHTLSVAVDTVITATQIGEAPADAYFARLEALNQHNVGGVTYSALPFAQEVQLASQVNLGNTNNTVPDPDFADPSSWSYGSAVRLPNTTVGKGSGTYKLRIDAAAAALAVSPQVTIEPQQPLTLSCYCETVSGTTGVLLCQVLYYKQDGTAASPSNTIVMNNSTGSTGRFTTTVLAPVDAVKAVFRFFRNTAGDRIWEVSEPVMRPAARIGTTLTLANGTTVPTDAQLVTLSGISAGYTGQTAWGTAPVSGGLAVTPTEAFNRVQNINTSGNLAALSNVVNRRMTLLFRADGSTALTEADSITSMGISSGFTGQTSWATAPTTGGSNRSPTEVFGRVSLIGNGGRVADPTMYNTQFMIGPRNVTNLVPTYTVGGSDVTVNLPAHNRVIAGPSGPLTLAYGAMSATWPFSSYWAAYVDDPNLAGIASPTVTLTSNPNDLLYAGRYQVASGVTPSSGGTGGGTGGGGGGGGGWDNCVAAESFMPHGGFAAEVKVGDRLLALDPADPDGTAWTACDGNAIAEADCVQLESASGILLVLSASTPCTLHDGETVPARAVEGQRLAVTDQSGFRWEEIVAVREVGRRAVAHICIGGGTYAAGQQQGRFIFTHNGTAKP